MAPMMKLARANRYHPTAPCFSRIPNNREYTCRS